MPCTEAYKEHIEYTFNAFCRVVIHYAAINAWRDRDKRRQREISFEYLTEEKFITYYMEMPVSYCFHPKIQKKEAVWPGKNRCTGDHSDTVRV